MPDSRSHRGQAQGDSDWFRPQVWPILRRAVRDFSWLQGQGYADASSLKLVGDRFALVDRQRQAVRRCSCSSRQRNDREARRIQSLAGRPLAIDGFNVLLTIESALGGAVILGARDRCFRDLASVHGSYRTVEETRPAVEAIGRFLAGRDAGHCTWYLDAPVSNSGRIKTLLREVAAEHGWAWRAEVVPDPDVILGQASGIVATADAVILDRCGPWFNLARGVVESETPGANVVHLEGPVS